MFSLEFDGYCAGGYAGYTIKYEGKEIGHITADDRGTDVWWPDPDNPDGDRLRDDSATNNLYGATTMICDYILSHYGEE